jgi:hypothetical protein
VDSEKAGIKAGDRISGAKEQFLAAPVARTYVLARESMAAEAGFRHLADLRVHAGWSKQEFGLKAAPGDRGPVGTSGSACGGHAFALAL